jgi:hypothetical protein
MLTEHAEHVVGHQGKAFCVCDVDVQQWHARHR